MAKRGAKCAFIEQPRQEFLSIMLASEKEPSTFCFDEVNELIRGNDVQFGITRQQSWYGNPINKSPQQLGKLRNTKLCVTVLFAGQFLAHCMAMEQALNDRVDVASVS